MGLTKNSRDLCQHPGGSRNSDAPLGIGRTGVSPERLHALIQCRRIAVVGKQGAGKTTFAQALARIIGLEYVEVPWKPNSMTLSKIDEIRQDMAGREAWIIDGDFGLLEMVEAIIHLDYPLSICLYRATRRTIENFLKWEFREAGWLAKIPRRVARYPQEIGEIFRYQYEPSKQPATSSDRTVITLKSPLELERLLAAIKRKLRDNTIA